ncbi:hypothetical protein GCM10009814_34550 [Lapillicoccus jejuensis]|uniref:DUF1345 domain-containing protein n=1 Tax=Lapillicoccus jejuensis TaxID=402171 RepID=A0A542DXJ8_9MICO|nr:hypothetical protein FB458_0879 [Lapillicoccus jejuensis]
MAVGAAGLLYALLPSSLVVGPRYVVPAVEAALLVALVVTNPVRLVRETRWSRWAAMALAVVMVVTNLVSLGLLVGEASRESTPGSSLLVAALQVWATNVVGFALLYWELDRGGPVSRRERPRSQLPAADFRFSQDEDDDTVDEVSRGSSRHAGWVPVFVDYLYVSLTNSSAFSPTDTMPLTSRAKVLMGTEASAALLTSLVVVARAVGGLAGGSGG